MSQRPLNQEGKVSFTDEDLKRVKLIAHNPRGWIDAYYRMPREELKALLARLEAAEKVCEYFSLRIRLGSMPDETSLKSLTAWLASKG